MHDEIIHSGISMVSALNPPLRKRLILWLSLCVLLVALMVVVGGLTRLTESGLSIVEWKPVMGALPPLSEADWQREFAAYQQTPQYHQLNSGMSLNGFKPIFWLEYLHRLLGRIIGLVFLFPYVFFLVRRALPKWLAWKLGIIFALGGLQGGVGWFMVKSGILVGPWVNPVRLMLHLGLAFLIIAALLAVMRQINPPVVGNPPTHLHRNALAFSLLIYAQILLGALVAGNHAGLIYNNFPMMGNGWVPDELNGQNGFLGNPAALQFFHRLVAYLAVVAAACVLLAVRRERAQLPAQVLQRAWLVLGAVLLQFALGVATLLLHVPVALASLHQANAVLLFILSVSLTLDFNSRPNACEFDLCHGQNAQKSI